MTAAPRVPGCDATEGCLTCGDVAEALEVVGVDAERGLALCARADGTRRTVETALVEPVEVGEALLVHADVAIARAAEELPS